MDGFGIGIALVICGGLLMPLALVSGVIGIKLLTESCRERRDEEHDQG